MTIRVVVADDHPMFRFGVTTVLQQAEDIDVVGEAADGDGLLALVASQTPDVVVTDLAMPGLDGIATINRLQRSDPGIGILVLSMHEDDAHVFAALRAGALGYLLKGADAREIVRAIQTVAAGDAVYGASIARRIIGLGGAAPASPLDSLTPRERQVLEALATGQRNAQIASSLDMAEKTVRNHVSSILLKLQVADRTAAALKAQAVGLGKNGPHANHP
jgi:DNA-binding NarL/FixJ family response regulator